MKTKLITKQISILLTALIITFGLLFPALPAFAEVGAENSTEDSVPAAEENVPAAEENETTTEKDGVSADEGVPAAIRLSALKDPRPFRMENQHIAIQSGRRTVQLKVITKYPNLELSYYTKDEESASVLSVDQNGTVTMLTDRPGACGFIHIHSAETPETEAYTTYAAINIELLDPTIKGPSSMTAVYGVPLKLKYTAPMKVYYRSDTKSIATVNRTTGAVSFKRPGKAIFNAYVFGNDVYKGNGKMVTVTCKLGKPTLKAKAGKKKVKLTWSKVPKTQKYLIYCKYPGKKKYKLVTKRLSTIKSVSHKNLKKGRKYSYKIRAYLKLDGKTYYGPYSNAVTVKVK